MADLSPTTGQTFYSGDWAGVQDIIRVLNIGEGKMDKVNQPMVNRYQEMVDRDIDAIIGTVVHVPIRAFNQIQPDGVTREVFPGDVRRAAKYWVAGQLILAEFQQLEQNVTDQAAQMIVDARRQMYDIARFTHRVPGQRQKSNLSRTMPAHIQPPQLPEQVSQ